MKFTIITHAFHKLDLGLLYAYEPYVREMNLWCKYVDEVKIVAPFSSDKILEIEEKYIHKNISLSRIPSFNALNILNKIKSIFLIPFILFRIFRAMYWADHIHLRCPGNIGLLGCFVQVLFPFKQKTVKYAGNWDPKSKQPLSYETQKWIISNTFFTRNCKVLVYGEWKNQSKNIVDFFTASYKDDEIIKVSKKDFSAKIKFIYVGAFTKGKQPLLSVKVIEKLIVKKVNVQLDMFGNGAEFANVKKYIEENNLENNVFFHGNQSKKVVKQAYQNSHFLIFISKSEGWPKVVAEAMFWSCLPISTKVSCVETMLGYGSRGIILEPNVNESEIAVIIENYLKNEDTYQKQVLRAKEWSQNYTLENFSSEIKKIILNE